MAEAVITSKGQITIPKSIRDVLKLKFRDKVIFIPIGDHAVMRPLKGDILDLRGSIKHRGRSVDYKQLRAEMEEDTARDVVKETRGKYASRRR